MSDLNEMVQTMRADIDAIQKTLAVLHARLSLEAENLEEIDELDEEDEEDDAEDEEGEEDEEGAEEGSAAAGPSIVAWQDMAETFENLGAELDLAPLMPIGTFRDLEKWTSVLSLKNSTAAASITRLHHMLTSNKKRVADMVKAKQKVS